MQPAWKGIGEDEREEVSGEQVIPKQFESMRIAFMQGYEVRASTELLMMQSLSKN